MEKKNIIIIIGVGVLIVLIAIWFIFEPLASNQSTTVQSPIVTQEQTPPHSAEQPKAEIKKVAPPKENKTTAALENADIYIVKEGDTLQRIAVEIFGDERYWINIFAANEPNIDWYDIIRPGQELMIPNIN